MKIAVIGAKGLPPKQGGIEHYCAEVYPRMVSQGHSVDLFARATYTHQPWFYQHHFQGVRVITLPAVGWRGLDAFTSSGLGVVYAHQYDVIHFHALGPALFSFFPRLYSSAKVVATCHGLDWQRAKWGYSSKRFLRWSEQVAVRYTHQLTVVSEDLQAYFWQTYRRQTCYIPNAPARYTQSGSNFFYGHSLGLQPHQYLLFLGRLVPEKCPDLLIKAFQRIQPQGWKLVLVGDHSDTSSFVTQLHKLSLNNSHIIFAGELLGSRLAEIVRGAGLFILPSRVEGLPLAMLEAMQEGIPVVASDIPAHQQLIGNQRGLLFPSGSVESCSSAIAWALENPLSMTAMARHAQKHIDQYYSWDRIVQQTLQIYTAEDILTESEPLVTNSKSSGF
ncbi:MAG: glycosyltransferase family 4 protein [Acaryochloridaceae cyanobacterium SU_2_1]|nr:glycosyltransferase family 4 protein [Acaryochloridaceae cyanobacterium SU_2_1]